MSVLRQVLLSNAAFTRGGRVHIKHIHSSTVALKKKKLTASSSQARADVDDAFAFNPPPEEDELFGSTATSSSETFKPLKDASPSGLLTGGKTPELLRIRAETFETLRTSTLELITRPGRLRQPPRKSTIKRLVALAETKEQLEKAVDLMATWRSAALPQEIEPSDFIGRCIALGCPKLALQVLKDRPKYGVDMPSLTSAHHLINALSKQPPSEDAPSRALHDTLSLAELYPLYGFPPASKDTVSCAILAGAMAREVLKTPKEEGNAADTNVSLGEIVAELKTAVAGWEGVDAMQPKRAAKWMRREVRYVLGAVRREGGTVQPWLQAFWEQNKGRPQASEGASLNPN